jgi:hypothetical protein
MVGAEAFAAASAKAHTAGVNAKARISFRSMLTARL